jgi:DNA-binding NarL/FixJ family response regulator
VKRAGKIRVLLVDDHPVVRDGIKWHLSTQPDLCVVGEADSGREAVRAAAELKPDVILMDVSMPQMNGLEAMAEIRRRTPGARVLVVTMHNNPEYVAQVVRLGARGYLLKDTSPKEFVSAIHVVHSGEAYFGPSASRALADTLARPDHAGHDKTASAMLSNRECEVLKMIAEGYRNKEIASHLEVGVRTIETHRERVMRKLNIHSVADLTRYAISSGLLTLSETAGAPKRQDLHR